MEPFFPECPCNFKAVCKVRQQYSHAPHIIHKCPCRECLVVIQCNVDRPCKKANRYFQNHIYESKWEWTRKYFGEDKSMKSVIFKSSKQKVEERNEANVFEAISIGDTLVKLKRKVGHGNWMEYMKKHVEYSPRNCENFMKLATTPIHKKYRKLGVTALVKMIRNGVDLSG